MTKQITFDEWLKAYPVILEKYGDLPKRYLRYMHFQSTYKQEEELLPDLTGWKETLRKVDEAVDDLIESRKEKK